MRYSPIESEGFIRLRLVYLTRAGGQRDGEKAVVACPPILLMMLTVATLSKADGSSFLALEVGIAVSPGRTKHRRDHRCVAAVLPDHLPNIFPIVPAKVGLRFFSASRQRSACGRCQSTSGKAPLPTSKYQSAWRLAHPRST